MEDNEIIRLYWERDELALEKTAEKYGAYCFAVANNILADSGEAEECVNDTWLGAWRTMPPKRPNRLKLFLAKITRNLALNRYKHSRREKRGEGFGLVWEEMADIAGEESVEDAYMAKELSEHINKFLASLSKKERKIVLRRYFYAESHAAIGKHCGEREENVRLILFRLRKKLRKYLEKEGFYV